MANYFKTLQLEPGADADINLSVQSGYGQPINTKVSHFKVVADIKPITGFDGNKSDLNIGRSLSLLNQNIRIFCTTYDVQDPTGGNETEDIQVTISLKCNGKTAQHQFTHSTSGTGDMITFNLEVTVQ